MRIEYHCPLRLDEAIGILLQYGANARVIAGGTDLLRMIKSGKCQQNLLVDITQIEQLRGIKQLSDGSVCIGAITTHHEVGASDLIKKKYTALAEGATSIGSRQIRNVATIGGNICNSSPSADTSPALLVFEARVIVAGSGGVREIPIERFFSGPSQNVMEKGEILTELFLTPPASKSGSAYIKLSPRKAMDTATVGVAAVVELNPESGVYSKCRISLGVITACHHLVPYFRVMFCNTHITWGPGCSR